MTNQDGPPRLLTNKQSLLDVTVWSKWTWISIGAVGVFWIYALFIRVVLDSTDTQPAPGIIDMLTLELFQYEFAYQLFINIGTAILISRIIAIFIVYEEQTNRENMFSVYMNKQQEFYDKRIQEAKNFYESRIEQVSKNAFRGVYQAQYPDELINEVLSIGFGDKIIRDDFTLVYTMRDLKIGENIEGVVLEAKTEYTITNIGEETLPDIPIGMKIPNPIQQSRKKYCEIIEYRKDYIKQDISEGVEKFKELRDSTNNAEIPIILDKVDLRQGQKLHVMLVYSMAKEIEDSEVLRTKYPTRGIKVTVYDETSEDYWVDATEIHRKPIIDISPPDERRTKEYRSPEFFLPQQGVIVFWKRRTGIEEEAGPISDDGGGNAEKEPSSEEPSKGGSS